MSSHPHPAQSGSLSPFGKESRGRGWVVPLGIGLSVGLHALAAVIVVTQPEQARQAARWVEMAVQAPPPPPPPSPPPPEPEKEKPKPKPQPVKFKDITPPTPTPPPEAAPSKPVRRVVQGLSATSFATGSGTGLSVRAGNSTTVAASGGGLAIEDANGPRSFASVTTPPTCTKRPMMDVPKEAQEAEVEGEIKVSFDVAVDGQVANVHVLRDLGHGTGDACAGAWRKVRCTPGKQDGTPVVVTGVPQTCTVRIDP